MASSTTTKYPGVALPDQILIEGVFARSHSGRSIARVVPLTPDASLRRYFRVSLTGAPRPLVVMVFDSLAVPEAVGANPVNSFDSYVSLTRFFSDHGIRVPELIAESSEPPVLILEDLGDTLLADLLLKKKESLSNSSTESYYRQAIDSIIALQSIPKDSELFAYQRAFLGDVYVREMHETLDFLLTPADISNSARNAVAESFLVLGDQLEGFPRVLTHRDFHSWNIMVDDSDRIRVIDFQDALMATRSYDLVGLLNDRDTDSALGTEVYKDLVRYFHSKWSYGDNFFEEYDRVLLQRDLKVAGRFAKLVNLRGLKSYGAWIPGTVRRIGRTLERLTAKPGGDKEFLHLLEIMNKLLPHIREGADSPLRFE